jgi:hypothetical protein
VLPFRPVLPDGIQKSTACFSRTRRSRRTEPSRAPSLRQAALSDGGRAAVGGRRAAALHTTVRHG